jgi:hypothetical protein
MEALRRDGYVCGHFQGASLESDTRPVAALALRHHIALSYAGLPDLFDTDGLLLQYRPVIDTVQDRLVAMMAKILRGQRPGDIPFEGPTRFVLRINLKTARRIGVNVPEDVLVMMDEVLR